LKKVVNKGIQLVEKGILEKIVLANRIKIKLKNKLDIVKILKRKIKFSRIYKIVTKAVLMSKE